MPRLTNLRSTAALVLLGLVSGCTGTPPPSTPEAFDVVVNDGGDPARAWVATTTGAPARPEWSGDWSQWAGAAQATPLSGLTVVLTVQVAHGEAKVKAARVKLVKRRPPIAGTQYVVVGADPVSYERLEFDLDHSLESRAVTAEGDTIAVTVQTQECDCDFVIELDWAGGTRTVDNNGKPFRVSATTATVGRCVTYPDRVEKCETF